MFNTKLKIEEKFVFSRRVTILIAAVFIIIILIVAVVYEYKTTLRTNQPTVVENTDMALAESTADPIQEIIPTIQDNVATTTLRENTEEVITIPIKNSLSPEDELNELIKEQFEQLLQSLAKKDGATAAQTVDQNTLDFYQHITDLANYGTEEQILSEPALIGGSVILTRILFRENNINSNTGYSTFMYSTTLGRSASIPSDLLKFNSAKLLTSNTADIYFESQGQIGSGLYSASKENGVWKINMVPVIQIAINSIESELGNNEVKKKNYIDFMIGTKGFDNENAWVPLQ